MTSPIQAIARVEVDGLPELPKHSLSRSEISTLRTLLKRAFRQSPWHLGALQEVYRQVRSVWVAEFTEDNVFTTDDVLREHFENTQHTATEAIAAERSEVVRLQAVTDEYQAWIMDHAAGGDFDDFLSKINRAALATPTQGETK